MKRFKFCTSTTKNRNFPLVFFAFTMNINANFGGFAHFSRTRQKTRDGVVFDTPMKGQKILRVRDLYQSSLKITANFDSFVHFFGAYQNTRDGVIFDTPIEGQKDEKVQVLYQYCQKQKFSVGVFRVYDEH